MCRSFRTLSFARIVASALLGLPACSAAYAQTGYTVTSLGGLGTDATRQVQSGGQALSSKGQAVGYSKRYNANHGSLGEAAFLFRNGSMQNLNTASFFGADTNGVSNSGAYGINDSGQITGYTSVYDAQHNLLGYAAFLWQNGAFTNLGSFGTGANGTIDAYGNGLNSLGQVCGYSSVYNNQHNKTGTAAFLWQSGKGLTNLGNFGTDMSGSGDSDAQAINNLTQVVGASQVYDSQHNYLGSAAFLWQNNVLTNLGNLGTDADGRSISSAYGINNIGLVVGSSNYYDTNHADKGSRAIFYDSVKTKTMTALPTLGLDINGSTTASANSINDRGQIVGSCNRYDVNGNFVEQDAALWQNNTVVNLNDYLSPGAGWLLVSAAAINKRGQITGYGIHNGAQEAFLLTPYIPGDFNNDGNPDILFQNSQTGDVALALLYGTTRVGSQPLISGVSLDWKAVATPDLNGDGYSDIVWQNSKTGDIAYWLLNNGHFAGYGYLYYGLPLNWKVVGSADFNADGYTDLVLQDSQTSNLAIWYLAGTDYYDFGMISLSLGAGWQIVGAGDMNGDGSPDLLLRNKTNGDLYTWLLNGLSVSKGSFIANIPLEWNMVGLGDFGGDGNVSLLWQNSKSNDLYYWRMNGTTQVGNGLIQSGVPGWQVLGPK